MSRPLRIQYPGAWYHVMNRGANRNKIYFDEKDYALFLVVVREATQIFQVKLSAYCLMDNHYHLVVHTPEGNLARFLRHVDGVYTQRFNRIHRRDGPLFRGRYKAILIEADEYLKQLVRYVHLNPVQAKLVQDPAQYPWSSHKEYLKGKTSEGWLYSKEVLGQFSKRVSQSIKLYGEFIREGVDEATRKFYGAQKQAAILGTEGFIERMKERFLEPQDEHWNEEVVEKRGLQQESRMFVRNLR
jgi:putative transposase